MTTFDNEKLYIEIKQCYFSNKVINKVKELTRSVRDPISTE